MTSTGTAPGARTEPGPLAALESKRRHAGWAMALRGVVAMIFGIVALRNPSAAAGVFVVAFAIFAFADGILDFVLASGYGRAGQSWGWYAFGGIVSILAGVVALAYPSVTLFVLVLLVAIRAIVMGIVELGAAFSWREFDSRWLLGLTGVLSIVLGILLFASPSAGGLALLWTIGVYAIVFGAMVFGLGVRVASSERHHALT
ncbi:MAG TPA: HdeD family acid-resistance protein [Kofleriaceae bacterium]